jgi:hypothetical protein
MDNLSDPIEDRKVEKGIIISGAIISLIVGIVILFLFLSKVSTSHSIPKDGVYFNLTSFGALGDFIAGVVGTCFSLCGIFLLFLTLKDQKENFYKERLESKFFEMVKFHRENVSEMQYSYYENQKQDSKVTSQKRKVFKMIFSQFKKAWEETKHFYDNALIESIYEYEYLLNLRSNKKILQREINLKELAKLDITYLIVFFGLSTEDKESILNLCKSKYKKVFVEDVLKFASLKPKKESKYWKTWEMIYSEPKKDLIFEDILLKRKNKEYIPRIKINRFYHDDFGGLEQFELFYDDDYNKYYGGHQFRLGHYFRHLYQTVKLIDKEKLLTSYEKYEYIKILRGQLSSYEQQIFFINSLSQIGRKWEFIDDFNEIKSQSFGNDFVTKYQLIKNIPTTFFIDGINVLNYYPEINYEVIGD